MYFFVYPFILCFVCSILLSVLGYPERCYTNEMYFIIIIIISNTTHEIIKMLCAEYLYVEVNMCVMLY